MSAQHCLTEYFAVQLQRTAADGLTALTEAIALYRSSGYREVDAFNDERYAHHWFEKRLPAATRRRARS